MWTGEWLHRNSIAIRCCSSKIHQQWNAKIFKTFDSRLCFNLIGKKKKKNMAAHFRANIIYSRPRARGPSAPVRQCRSTPVSCAVAALNLQFRATTLLKAQTPRHKWDIVDSSFIFVPPAWHPKPEGIGTGGTKMSECTQMHHISATQNVR